MKLIVRRIKDKRTGNNLNTELSQIEATMPHKLSRIVGTISSVEFPSRDESVGELSVVGNKVKLCIGASHRVVWSFNDQQALEKVVEKLNELEQKMELTFLSIIWKERVETVEKAELSVQEFVKGLNEGWIEKPVYRSSVVVEFQVIDLEHTLRRIEKKLEELQNMKLGDMEKLVSIIAVCEQINRSLWHSDYRWAFSDISREPLQRAIYQGILCPLKEIQRDLRKIVKEVSEVEAAGLRNEFSSFASWLEEFVQNLKDTSIVPEEPIYEYEEIEEAKEELF